MSQWNKAYLDALEVPVWVPLNAHETAKEQEASSGPAPEPEASQTREPLKLKLLQGDNRAKFAFVISEDEDLKTALLTFQQIQFAWQAWLDKPLPAALLQTVSLSDSDDNLIGIEDFHGQLIDCRQSANALERAALSAPTFDFKQADKKAWWQLLQRLH
ncbi:hypothetical protein [Kangiella shandongensis]|uniref:hypothetical protein n=1 Tax=Kangiella shandongensis TaxID=2763258 RepID=UPI001CC145F2|nr:hypothetical protein [Kangiella shandongensis]